jgi:hypothetical protein
LYIEYLEELLAENESEIVNYAFVRNRNCALGAFRHIGFSFTLSIDLVNFFDSITANHLKDIVEYNVLNDCLIDGSPKQGLPTSPMLSNIAFLKSDCELIRALRTLSTDIVYTRYADDLIFSFNRIRYLPLIKSIVQSVMSKNGFEIHPKKIKVQSAKNGRRVVTGIAVGEDDIFPTRKLMKKIRAAGHQGRKRSLNGLKECAKCQFPKNWVASAVGNHLD